VSDLRELVNKNFSIKVDNRPDLKDNGVEYGQDVYLIKRGVDLNNVCNFEIHNQVFARITTEGELVGFFVHDVGEWTLLKKDDVV